MNVVDMTDGLKRGLRSSDDHPRNVPSFETLRGTRATEYGLIPLELPTNVDSYLRGLGVTYAAPFPQVFSTSKFGRILCYQIDTTEYVAQITTPLTFYELDDPTYTYTIVAGGGGWNCLDLGDTVILQNTLNVLMLNYQGVHYGYSRIKAQCGCVHRGRALFGGFGYLNGSVDAFWGAAWSALRALIGASAPVTYLTLLSQQNTVWFSGVGGYDVRMLFEPTYAIYGPKLGAELLHNGTFRRAVSGTWDLGTGARYDGTNDEIDFESGYTMKTLDYHGGVSLLANTKYVIGFEVRASGYGVQAKIGAWEGEQVYTSGYYWQEFTNETAGTTAVRISGAETSVTNVTLRKIDDCGHDLDHPYVVDMAARADSGQVPLPWSGRPLALKSLDTTVIAYCESGVAMLHPIVDPVSTFGVRVLLNTGIATKWAVAGNEYVHVFVDKTGVVWRLGSGGKLDRLDYQWAFASMTSIVVAYDEAREEFYLSGIVSGADKGYLLSRSGGLSELPYQCCSLSVYQGSSFGAFTAVAWTSMRGVTDVFDCDFRGMKTLREVELGLSSSANQGTVTVQFKADRSETAWRYAGPYPIRGGGRCPVLVTGVEFRIALDFALNTTVEIDSMRVHWQPGAAKTNAKVLLGG